MRATALSLITSAAVTAGLLATSVIEHPHRQNITLPAPRLEVDWAAEVINRGGRRIARVLGTQPATHQALRWSRYEGALTARCTARSSDPDWIEDFYRDFLLSLPRKSADAQGNLVTISISRAVRGGFDTRIAEIEKKLSNTMHVTFTGIMHQDEEIPWIRDVTFNDISVE